MIVGAGYKTQDGVGNRRLEVKDWLLEVGDWGDWTVRIRSWRLKDALLKTEGMKVPVGRPGCWASTSQDSHLLPQTLFTYWDGHRCNENWGVGVEFSTVEISCHCTGSQKPQVRVALGSPGLTKCFALLSTLTGLGSLHP